MVSELIKRRLRALRPGIVALLAIIGAASMAPTASAYGWHHGGWRGGWGWHRPWIAPGIGVGIGLGYGYYPPPAYYYYPRPRVYYAPVYPYAPAPYAPAPYAPGYAYRGW
jgi:hypothetical protein